MTESRPLAPTPPRLADLRRLNDGFNRIGMMEFCGAAGERWPTGDEWMEYMAAPLSFVAEPERDAEHVEALIRMAWELGE